MQLSDYLIENEFPNKAKHRVNKECAREPFSMMLIYISIYEQIVYIYTYLTGQKGLDT